MRYHLRSLLCKLLIVFIILFTVGLFNFIFDPCMVFRKHNKNVFWDYRVLTVYNKVRYGTYETINIGSSTSTQTSESMINRILPLAGNGSRNLSTEGTTSHLVHAIVKLAIYKQPVKRIIYGYDLFMYNHKEDEKTAEIYKSSFRLYDEIKYLLDFKLAYIQFVSLVESQIRYARYLNENASKNSKNKKKEANGNIPQRSTAHFFHNRFITGFIVDNKEQYITNVEELANIIRDNPRINFVIYFTPYHILYWYQMSKLNELNNAFEFKKETIKRLLPLKNVSLYDFQTIDEIIFDTSSFLDSVHYFPYINEKVLKLIKEDTYRVSNNYSSYVFENDIRRKIERFTKENAQSLIDYKCEQELKLIKEQIDLKRKRAIHQ